MGLILVEDVTSLTFCMFANLQVAVSESLEISAWTDLKNQGN